MAKEIQVGYPTSAVTLYAVVLNSVGQFWNTAGAAFENFNAANWADYNIPLAEQSTTGIYLGDFPVVSAGFYNLAILLRAGGSPAVTDDTIAAGVLGWDGSAVVNPPSVAMIQAGTSLLDLAVMIQGDGTAAAKFTAAALSLAPTGGGGGGGGMLVLGNDGIYRGASVVNAAGSIVGTVPLDQQYGLWGNTAGDVEFTDESGTVYTITVTAPWQINIRAVSIGAGTTAFPLYVLKSKVSTP